MAVTWRALAYAADVIANSLLTTRGDIIRRGASAPERLAIGANTYVLTSDGTDAVWAAPGAASNDMANIYAFAAANG